MTNLPSWLTSSADPTKISLTLKALVPTVLLITALLKVDFSELSANILIDNLVQIITSLGLLASSLTTIYGIIRKFGKKDFNSLGKGK